MTLLKWTFLVLAATTIPRPLTDYRHWTRITPDPERVPYSLSVQCAPITKAMLEDRGPHEDRYVAVYANRIAVDGFRDAAAKFPEGSIIAKEKLLKPDDAHPDGVAFMIKHGKGELAASGGWEFAYYPAEPKARYDGCANCHRSGGSKDYVFNTFTPDQR